MVLEQNQKTLEHSTNNPSQKGEKHSQKLDISLKKAESRRPRIDSDWKHQSNLRRTKKQANIQNHDHFHTHTAWLS